MQCLQADTSLPISRVAVNTHHKHNAADAVVIFLYHAVGQPHQQLLENQKTRNPAGHADTNTGSCTTEACNIHREVAVTILLVILQPVRPVCLSMAAAAQLRVE
jgi:hypothetical protein